LKGEQIIERVSKAQDAEKSRFNDIHEVDCVRKVEILEVLLNAGDGTEKSPVRSVYQYWTKDGRLIAIKDPLETKKMWDSV